jgi:hypothetical protein
MSRNSDVNSDTLWKLYNIGGADLGLRYADIASSQPEPRQFEFLDLRFFEGAAGAEEPASCESPYRFARKQTRYVYFRADMRNPWQHFDWTYQVVARFFQPDGSLMGEINEAVTVKPDWDTFFLIKGWGFETPGRWPPGTYQLELSLDEHRTSGEFTIVEESARSAVELPSLFSSNDRNPPQSRLLTGLMPNLLSEALKTPQAPTQGLGFEGWWNKLDQEFGDGDEGDEIPQDDLGKLRRLMAIDRRQMMYRMKNRPGFANGQVLEALLKVRRDYEALLAAGVPASALYTADSLRGKIAETDRAIAETCELIDEQLLAEAYYRLAEDLFDELGRPEDAQRCREAIARLRYDRDGDLDGEIERLQSQLNTQAEGTTGHVRALIDLAGLHANNGDDYEAEALFREAETELAQIGGDPNGTAMADTLKTTLFSIQSGTPALGGLGIETAMELNGLYRSLYNGLAGIYAGKDPERAAGYREFAGQRDSRAFNDAFSEQMLNSLSHLFK